MRVDLKRDDRLAYILTIHLLIPVHRRSLPGENKTPHDSQTKPLSHTRAHYDGPTKRTENPLERKNREYECGAFKHALDICREHVKLASRQLHAGYCEKSGMRMNIHKRDLESSIMSCSVRLVMRDYS